MNSINSLQEILLPKQSKSGVVRMIVGNTASVVTASGSVTASIHGTVRVGDQVILFDGKCQRYDGKILVFYL